MNPIRSSLVFALSVLCGSVVACHRDNASGVAPPPTTTQNPSAQGDSGSADPGTPPPGETVEPSAPASQFTGAGQFLPQATSVDGWRQSGAVRHATPHDLFQIMDGEAASYEQYGVRDYASTEYRAPAGGMITQVQIYEFADALGAFGRYSLTTTDGRDPALLQPQSVQRGGGGFMGSTELDFWKGNHLVQITYQDDANSDESALATAAHASLPRFAAAIDHALTGTTQLPANPLAAEGMVWGGTAYLADQAFGADHSGPAWVGFYRATDGKRYRVGVLARGNATDAQASFAAFRAPGAAPIAHVGDEAFAVARGEAGELVVARRSNNVYVVADSGIAGAPSPDRAAKLAILRAWLSAPIAAPAPAAADTAPTGEAPAAAPAAPSAPDADAATAQPIRTPISAVMHRSLHVTPNALNVLPNTH